MVQDTANVSVLVPRQGEYLKEYGRTTESGR